MENSIDVDEWNRDIKFLWRCIEVGKRADIRQDYRNGCIIASCEFNPEGEPLSLGYSCFEKGYTSEGKIKVRHAERAALESVALEFFDLSKITLYSSLEPCYLEDRGNVQSCAELIVISGIKRVAFALVDPNTRIVGEEYLRQQRIEVANYSHFFTDYLQEEIKGLIKPAPEIDMKHVTRGKPMDLELFRQRMRKELSRNHLKVNPRRCFGMSPNPRKS